MFLFMKQDSVFLITYLAGYGKQAYNVPGCGLSRLKKRQSVPSLLAL